MNFGRHSLVSTLFAVLYGGVMLFGQGLHELVDCGHGHGHSHACAEREHCEDGHCPHSNSSCPAGGHGLAHACEGSHAPERGGQHAEGGIEHSDESEDAQSLAIVTESDLALDDSDCPICQFHSQGQLRAVANAPVPQRAPSSTISRNAPQRLAEFSLGIHSPRGPPA